MDAIMIECKKCKERFLTILKPGKVTCPKCGNTDEIIKVCEGDPE